MNDEEMLRVFISKFMKSTISEQDFEDGAKSLARPDATQTKSFYLQTLGASLDNEEAHNVLGVLNGSDDDVEANINIAAVDKPQLKKCLEILFRFSQGGG